MICAKFGWNWASGSGEEDIFNLSVYIQYFVIISPRKKEGPLFKQTWIPSTQRWFVSSLVEIGPVVLKKKNFKIR